MKKAHKLYKQEKGTYFTLMHWFHPLENQQKWKDTYVKENSISKKIKIKEEGTYTTSSCGNTNDDGIDFERPIGQKAAKRNRGKVKQDESNPVDQSMVDIEL